MKPADIIAFRKMHNLSQAALGKKLSVSRTSVSNWETGRKCMGEWNKHKLGLLAEKMG